MVHPKVLPVFLGFLAVLVTIFGEENRRGSCSLLNHNIRIGVIVDEKSCVGKEQKLAMEIAVEDFNQASTCFKMKMLLQPLEHPHQSSAASAAIDLVRRHKSVHAIVGELSLQESVIVSEFTKLPIIIHNSLQIPAKSPPLNIFQMSNNNILTIQMQCISDIIARFDWKKVTALYEQSNSFSSSDLGIITQFSDSLRNSTNSVVDHHLGFPPIFSLDEPEPFIQQELKKLKQKSTRVFVILQASLEFATLLFKKAKEEGMMEKGYVWIISDDLATFLDSMEPTLIQNMQGVIGFKTLFFEENNKPHKDFRLKFLRKFITKYSEDRIFSPSKHAFRAYDAIGVLGKAMESLEGSISSRKLIHEMLSSDSQGLSGRLRFKNGFLSQKTVFSIVNVIGKSYRKLSQWEQNGGFFEDSGEGMHRVFWPGGDQEVPLGYTSSLEEQLKIAVPLGACEQFVKVSFDKEKNESSFSGFSIKVFEAAVNKLRYNLNYTLLPFNGTYSDMVKAVNNETYNAAIGDVTILAKRYEMADFSLPYVETSMVMIVPATSRITEGRFAVMRAFKLETWLVMALMNIFTGAVIYLNENINGNPDFSKGSFPQHIGAALWLSITIISLSQRQYIKHNLSRLVLATWLCVIIVAAASFTAVLSSMMTVKGLYPLITDLNINAHVGCNERSFIVEYLETVLGYPPSNVEQYESLDQYPEAFKTGKIEAAFMSAPHAKVFLAKYCDKYALAGPTWKFGGMGFVFQQDSNLAKDISEAILNITEKGEIDKLEDEMLSSINCTSSTGQGDDPGLGITPFSGLLILSGSVCGIVLIIALFRILEKHWSIHGFLQSLLISLRVCIWVSRLLSRFSSTNGFKFFGRPSPIERTNVEMSSVHGHGEDRISTI